MKSKRTGVMAAVLLGSTILLSGCSFSDVMDQWMGMDTDKPKAVVETSSESEAMQDIKTVDTDLEAPAFTKNLGSSMQMTVGSSYTMHVEAAVSDGGSVTYQWYRNNTNSNGGGTLLEGATGADYTVEASATGTSFYYAVATNEHGEQIAMSTSATQQVIVVDAGQWVQEADGTWSYSLTDGTKPVSTWMIIDGQTYYFNDAGRRAAGWTKVGETDYYFNENGELQRNAATPDGASTDENGARVS